MNDIVLINPPVKRVVEEYDAPDYPHIGLAYLGACLEENGFIPAVIDSKLERCTFDETIEKVIALSPKIVCITSMTHEIVNAHELAERIKSINCKITIVIGGVHITALPESTLNEFVAFDIGVVGEGEFTLVEICRRLLLEDGDMSGIPGIVFRDKKNSIVIGLDRPYINDLDALPFPAWHLFPKAKQYPVLTSRGCPSRCIFCAHSYGLQIRERSPKNILAEWRLLHEQYMPRQIRMYDETFGVNKKRAIEFLELVIQNKLEIPWFGYTRANTASTDLMSSMQKSGCYNVGIGVETGDPLILKQIKKGITLDQVKNAIKSIHDAGMESEAYFILGFPNESFRTIWRTIRFAAKLNSTRLALGIIVPYPGTEIAKMAAKGLGGYRIISQDWSSYNKQLGNALELKNISRLQLELLQLFGYIYFYLSNFRFLEFARFCFSYKKQAKGFLRQVIKRIYRSKVGNL
jgi:anaerobic magnesium-protoporphyrin IX monomethyl ester cyclase